MSTICEQDSCLNIILILSFTLLRSAMESVYNPSPVFSWGSYHKTNYWKCGVCQIVTLDFFSLLPACRMLAGVTNIGFVDLSVVCPMKKWYLIQVKGISFQGYFGYYFSQVGCKLHRHRPSPGCGSICTRYVQDAYKMMYIAQAFCTGCALQTHLQCSYLSPCFSKHMQLCPIALHLQLQLITSHFQWCKTLTIQGPSRFFWNLPHALIALIPNTSLSNSLIG